ncbi:hypothetical protein EWM64_g6210 [Hericium alpestre]|uniref:Essential protein Yae1 N-terminal domain-containing protein n=1 Tax=Hericium alpestre TaxID=135208 RepID=A0A4Y9ZUT5_9AGAM|nr:hypothetical protein EWM64_g6210 [Hericium alpestre]
MPPAPTHNDVKLPMPGIEPGEPCMAAVYKPIVPEPTFIDCMQHDDIVALVIWQGYEADRKEGRNSGFREGLAANTKAGWSMHREEGSSEGTKQGSPEASTPAPLAMSIDEIDTDLLVRICKEAEYGVWEEGLEAGMMMGRKEGREGGYWEGYEAVQCEVSTASCVPIAAPAVDASLHPATSLTSTPHTDPTLAVPCLASTIPSLAPRFEPGKPLAPRTDEPHEALSVSANMTPAPPTNIVLMHWARSLSDLHPDLMEQVLDQGRHKGWKEGKKEGQDEGYSEGLEAGRRMGMMEGRECGFVDGKSTGVQAGRVLERVEVRRIARGRKPTGRPRPLKRFETA